MLQMLLFGNSYRHIQKATAHVQHSKNIIKLNFFSFASLIYLFPQCRCMCMRVWARTRAHIYFLITLFFVVSLSYSSPILLNSKTIRYFDSVVHRTQHIHVIVAAYFLHSNSTQSVHMDMVSGQCALVWHPKKTRTKQTQSQYDWIHAY